MGNMLGGPYNKDCSILWSISGYSNFEKLRPLNGSNRVLFYRTYKVYVGMAIRGYGVGV